MLREIGVKDVEELYKEIPEKLRFKEKLNIPGPFLSEYELKSKMLLLKFFKIFTIKYSV
jgi:glycine dehydrogenase subunit 1